jgi:hypothetical protein
MNRSQCVPQKMVRTNPSFACKRDSNPCGGLPVPCRSRACLQVHEPSVGLRGPARLGAPGHVLSANSRGASALLAPSGLCRRVPGVSGVHVPSVGKLESSASTSPSRPSRVNCRLCWRCPSGHVIPAPACPSDFLGFTCLPWENGNPVLRRRSLTLAEKVVTWVPRANVVGESGIRSPEAKRLCFDAVRPVPGVPLAWRYFLEQVSR